MGALCQLQNESIVRIAKCNDEDGMESLAHRLNETVESCGLTTEEWLRRLRVSRGTFNNYVSGRRKPTFEFLAEFSHASGISLDYLIKGEGAEYKDRNSVDFEDDAFVKINVFDIDLAAGDGRVADNENPIDQLAFRSTWLDRVGINPAHASIVRVEGKSMEPTLQNKSVVLIDHRDKTPISKSYIFACRLGEDLKVKRVERDAKNKVVMLHSDNPDVSTEALTGDDLDGFEIIGRVVWTSRTFPE